MSEQLLDFYFSAKHWERLQRIQSKRYEVFFKEQKYTECITHGMKPLSLNLVENGFNYS